MIHAFRLVNGMTILQDFEPGEVTHFPIELVEHDVIFLNSCLNETVFDEGFRSRFQNVATHHLLYSYAALEKLYIAHCGRGATPS